MKFKKAFASVLAATMIFTSVPLAEYGGMVSRAADGEEMLLTEEAQTNEEEIAVSDGLIGYYTFDAAADASGYANAAAGTGALGAAAVTGPNFLTHVTDPVKGGCINLSNNNQIKGYLTIPAHFQPRNASTYSFWMKPDKEHTNQGNYVSVLHPTTTGGRGGSSAGRAFVTYHGEGNQIATYITGNYDVPGGDRDYNGRVTESNTIATDDGWWHCTMVHDPQNSRITFYVNGSMVKQWTDVGLGSLLANAAAPSAMLVGVHRADDANSYSGRMDDLRVYNRALSGDEVSTIYTSELPKLSVSAQVIADSDSTPGTAVVKTADENGEEITETAYRSNVKFAASPADGYVFAGWYENGEASGEPVNTDPEYPVTNVMAEKTLYAKFTKKQVAVTAGTVTGYDQGTVSVKLGEELAGETVDWGSDVTFTATPNPGYEFAGWFTDDQGTQQVENAEATHPVESVTGESFALYAKFTKITPTGIQLFENGQEVSGSIEMTRDERNANPTATLGIQLLPAEVLADVEVNSSAPEIVSVGEVSYRNESETGGEEELSAHEAMTGADELAVDDGNAMEEAGSGEETGSETTTPGLNASVELTAHKSGTATITVSCGEGVSKDVTVRVTTNGTIHFEVTGDKTASPEDMAYEYDGETIAPTEAQLEAALAAALDGYRYTVMTTYEELCDAIEAGNLTVTLAVECKKLYRVTVEEPGKIVANGEEVAFIDEAYMEYVTVKAPDYYSGKKFVAWYDTVSRKNIGYRNQYKFFVRGNMNLVPKYKKMEELEKIDLEMLGEELGEVEAGKNGYLLTAIRTVPASRLYQDERQIIRHGILMTADAQYGTPDPGQNVDDIEWARLDKEAGIVRPVANAIKNSQATGTGLNGIYTAKARTTKRQMFARSYVIYKDINGEMQVQFSSVTTIGGN